MPNITIRNVAAANPKKAHSAGISVSTQLFPPDNCLPSMSVGALRYIGADVRICFKPSIALLTLSGFEVDRCPEETFSDFVVPGRRGGSDVTAVSNSKSRNPKVSPWVEKPASDIKLG